MLHLLSRSRLRDPVLYERAIRALNENDALVFIGDGVLSLAGIDVSDIAARNVSFYFIEEDLKVRGWTGQVPDAVQPIDMLRLVELSREHPRSVSWY